MLDFPRPVGDWSVRVRVLDDERARAEEVTSVITLRNADTNLTTGTNRACQSLTDNLDTIQRHARARLVEGSGPAEVPRKGLRIAA